MAHSLVMIYMYMKFIKLFSFVKKLCSGQGNITYVQMDEQTEGTYNASEHILKGGILKIVYIVIDLFLDSPHCLVH